MKFLYIFTLRALLLFLVGMVLGTILALALTLAAPSTLDDSTRGMDERIVIDTPVTPYQP